MCHFAYPTYKKTLIELRTYVRGLPLEELIKMQMMDDTITDLTHPTSDCIIKQYDRSFHHCPISPKEHKLTVVEVRHVIPVNMPKRRTTRRKTQRQKGLMATKRFKHKRGEWFLPMNLTALSVRKGLHQRGRGLGALVVGGATGEGKEKA